MEKDRRLKGLATLNLWGRNLWNERRGIVIDEFNRNELTADKGTVLAFQEAEKEPLEEISDALRFERRHIYFYPTTIGGQQGLAILTNLEVSRKDFKLFSLDNKDPLEFGERGVGMLEVKTDEKDTVLAVTHLTVSPRMQIPNARECMSSVKKFALSSLKDKGLTPDSTFSEISKHVNIVIAGDFNAAPDTPAYEAFVGEGLSDVTKSLREKYGHTWPSDSDWFIEAHKKTFGGAEPSYDVREKGKRWMDYIWIAGIGPREVRLLGTSPKNGIYMSDHLSPSAFF